MNINNGLQVALYHYQTGGSLGLDSPTYVARQADEDLFKALKDGQFCYVLNARQMGKSSLRVRTMKRLQEAGIACAEVDLTGVGSQGLTEEQWYGGVVNELIRGLPLPEGFDWRSWWRELAPLAHVQRWGRFIEEILLGHIQQNIVIFIDEIDSVLGLQFPFDDFFAQIRFCHNKRADHPDYQRLTFCLLGVATPSDLIQDRRRTPFNIGRAVELTGFQPHEAEPLAKGLMGRTNNPLGVMQAILKWTGGQPFLTQKVCQLILEDQATIPIGSEERWIEEFVKTRILENWEAQDEPEHLRTIRNRIFRSKQHASHLLKLYQHILEQGSAIADNSPEQAELRLSGLVVKRNSVLEVYNPIYRAVFNQNWLEEALAKFQPQDEAIAERLGAIRDTILQHRTCKKLLELYQRILQEKRIPFEDSPESQLLLNLGLIKHQDQHLEVASRVYSNFFNEEWVEQELDKARQRRIIKQRYEVIERLDNGKSIQTYLVKDLQHPAKIQCILKQIIPPHEVGVFAERYRLFTDTYLELQQLNTHPDEQIANLIACFDEDEKFYLVQEFVEGQNLDEELALDPSWSESRVIGLLIDILSIVEFVHALNLSHGNLKPSNIRRRTNDQKLVLLDFGTLKQISAPSASTALVAQSAITPGYRPRIPHEDWTEMDLDIYAVGMIGIRALTGIEAEDFSVDRISNEVIWRFSTLGKRGTSASPELAAILDKMVSHHRENRYATVSQILQELHNLQPTPLTKPLRFKANKPLLAACLVALFATNLGGYWLYSNLFKRHQESQQVAQETERIAQETEWCKKALISSQDGENPINVDMISQAKNIVAACQKRAADTQDAAIEKKLGEAFLILGRSSQALKQNEEANQYLLKAQQHFQNALAQKSNDPQAYFYRGLAKQLNFDAQKDASYGADFEEAMRLYFARKNEQVQAVDFLILSKLAAYLGEQYANGGRNRRHFDTADRLYQKALTVSTDQVAQPYKNNLNYNRGVLNYLVDPLRANQILVRDVGNVGSSSPAARDFVAACIMNGSTNQDLCAQISQGHQRIPFVLPVYSCKDYPTLAIAKVAAGKNPDNLCE